MREDDSGIAITLAGAVITSVAGVVTQVSVENVDSSMLYAANFVAILRVGQVGVAGV
jgi:hypothetical protein